MNTLRLLLLVAMSFTFTPLNAAETGQGAPPTPREMYKYVWDYVIMGDAQATAQDLQTIANYYSRLPIDKQNRIRETHASPALSDLQKRETMRQDCLGCRKGTVVTTDGETYQGVVELMASIYRDARQESAPERALEITLAKGGKTSVPVADIVEVSFKQPQHLIKTAKGTKYEGKIESYYNFRIYTVEQTPIAVYSDKLQAVIYGPLTKVQCSSCFIKMEPDWKFCPHDGTKLE